MNRISAILMETGLVIIVFQLTTVLTDRALAPFDPEPSTVNVLAGAAAGTAAAATVIIRGRRKAKARP